MTNATRTSSIIQQRGICGVWGPSSSRLSAPAGRTCLLCVYKARVVCVRHFVSPSGVQDQKDSHEGANRRDERVIQVLMGQPQGKAEATRTGAEKSLVA